MKGDQPGGLVKRRQLHVVRLAYPTYARHQTSCFANLDQYLQDFKVESYTSRVHVSLGFSKCSNLSKVGLDSRPRLVSTSDRPMVDPNFAPSPLLQHSIRTLNGGESNPALKRSETLPTHPVSYRPRACSCPGPASPALASPFESRPLSPSGSHLHLTSHSETSDILQTPNGSHANFETKGNVPLLDDVSSKKDRSFKFLARKRHVWWLAYMSCTNGPFKDDPPSPVPAGPSMFSLDCRWNWPPHCRPPVSCPRHLFW